MKNYLSLVKFSHTVFAMPFAMIGFTLGWYYLTHSSLNLDSEFGDAYTWKVNPQSAGYFKQTPILYFFAIKLSLVIICMITARNAAMAFNRFIDRKYDEKNPRTAIREIPSGIITPKNALVFVVINCALFIAATYFINPICFYLSPVALAVILGYSLTKRFTFLCHLILGIGLGLAPIGAYLAVTGRFDLMPIAFSFAVFCWVSGFDIIYALQDEQFDKEQKLYSIPSYFGIERAKWIARVLHLISFSIIFFIGKAGNFSFLYWFAATIFGGLLIYQHYVVQKFGLEKINLAFFTLNGIASILFGILVITDIIIHL